MWSVKTLREALHEVLTGPSVPQATGMLKTEASENTLGHSSHQEQILEFGSKVIELGSVSAHRPAQAEGYRLHLR